MTSPAAIPAITDFHCHVLPKADHGSDGIATSLRQLQLLRRAGVERLVATPHFYPDKTTIDRFLAKREHCFRELAEVLPEGNYPAIHIGAEVLLVEGLHEMDGLETLCVSGTNVLLLELPMRKLNTRLTDTVAELCDNPRLRIVLAHIERYPFKEVETLLDLPLSAQVNAGAFTSLFGSKRYKTLLDEGKLVALGSDLHGADEAGVARFRKACGKLGQERLRTLMEATDRLLTASLPAYIPA